MPIYEYGCPECGLRFEKLRKMADSDLPAVCPECKEPEAQRLVSATNFTFAFPSSQLRGAAPPNTGTSFDHNADLVIGRDAEQKWKAINERQQEKINVLKSNPGATGFDLSKQHDGSYKVMSPQERKTVESAREINKKAMADIKAQKEG